MRFLTSFTFCLLIALGISAQTKDYSLQIGDFNEITVANSINVIYKQSADSAGLATYSCTPAQASALTFSNEKSKLKIQLAVENPVNPIPTVTVYSLALSKATNWGDSTLTIARSNPGAQFKLKVLNNGYIIANDIHTTKVEAAVVAGNGSIHLTGKAKEAKYTIKSVGSIEAGNLEAAIVKCSMMGTGSIDCEATESLTVRGLGPGTIYYRGKPAKIKNQGLGVKVVAVD